MTLRNAFEGMVTEAVMEDLLGAIETLIQMTPARDANDRLRIVSDNASNMTVSTFWGNFNTAPA